MDNCPLCGYELTNLRGIEREPWHKDFHAWCDNCAHGWYNSDLQNFAGARLAYFVSNGKRGMSDEQIKDYIRSEEADKELANE